MSRCLFAALLLSALVLPAAPKKTTGTAKGENEDLILTVTLYIDPAEIKQLVGSDLGGHYFVADVKVEPKYGKEVNIDRDDFLLRTDKDGERATPYAGSQVAGKNVIVLSKRPATDADIVRDRLRASAEMTELRQHTGAIPIQDEEFATLKDHATENAIGTVIVVLAILWLALKSPRIILAVFLSIAMGLAITAALGLRMVGSLNPISIAFAVLFVGIGVDFGIQFSVRYRAERYEINNLRVALANTAKHVGVPLTLAATATAAGFMSFLPTDYRGVSELGQIAGVGMIIAFVISITLLPALLKVLNPPGEKEPLGYSALAPIDRFMERHRIAIIVGTAVVVLGGLPLLTKLQFDFNPINLNSPKV